MQNFIYEIKTYLKEILKFFHYPLFTISLGFILGASIAEQLHIDLLNYGSLIVLIAIIILIFTTKSKTSRIILILIFSVILGVGRHNLFFKRDQSYIANFYGVQAEIEGKVIFDPDIGVSGNKITIETQSLKINDLPQKVHGKLLVTTPRYPVHKYGDHIRIIGVLEEPKPFDSFDYKDYLRTQNIETVIRPFSIELVDKKNNDPILLISKFKYLLSSKIKTQLPEPHSSLVLGILIGTKENMPKQFDEFLSVTSTTHIIAVSGYNVSVILALILSLAGLIPRKLSVILAYIILFLFMFLVGLNNLPAMRASIMGFAFLTSQVIGRRGGIISFLPLSAAFLVFLNPISYKSISFQLSFFSTLGLVLLNNKIEDYLKIIPEIFRKELSPTFSATFSTLPIILSNFGQISTISPLVNMLVLPVVPIVMLLGAVYSILVFISYSFSKIFSVILYLPLEYMIRIIELFGRLEFTRIDVGFAGNILSLFILILLFYFSLKFNVEIVPKNKA